MNGAENNHAYGIERCSCPAEYSGLSCQDPGPGYYRFKPQIPNKIPETIDDYIGKSLPCDCNGRSNECNPETGVCLVRSYIGCLMKAMVYSRYSSFRTVETTPEEITVKFVRMDSTVIRATDPVTLALVRKQGRTSPKVAL